MKKVLVLAVIVHYGCNKYDLPSNVPNCMDDIIETYDALSIYSLEVNDTIYFDVFSGHNDGFSPLVNEDCEVICGDDGWTGNNCRVEIQMAPRTLIWKRE